jgi:hypothetical protein
MKDLMIDIETMGNTPNAVMIQLAAVFFERRTGETGREFCKSLTIPSCEDFGFTKDESTVKWWQEQNQDVLTAILSEGEHALDVMDAFLDFLGKDIKDVIVWSHATFDFPIVQNYLKSITSSYMNYKGARDIRTLVDLSGIELDKYDWTKKTHNALDDCKFQIKYCVDAINKIKRI